MAKCLTLAPRRKVRVHAWMGPSTNPGTYIHTYVCASVHGWASNSGKKYGYHYLHHHTLSDTNRFVASSSNSRLAPTSNAIIIIIITMI